MQIKKQFIKFLKEEGVYYQYWMNWDNQNAKDWFIDAPRSYIYHAFDISTTKEPNEMWHKINKKWLSHLESIGYKK